MSDSVFKARILSGIQRGGKYPNYYWEKKLSDYWFKDKVFSTKRALKGSFSTSYGVTTKVLEYEIWEFCMLEGGPADPNYFPPRIVERGEMKWKLD